jgi:hypothetical protein
VPFTNPVQYWSHGQSVENWHPAAGGAAQEPFTHACPAVAQSQLALQSAATVGWPAS